ncbi:MAG: hypothetical protein WCV81_02735 [Microgenomates group bacterium]|jgi:hypothetical protein
MARSEISITQEQQALQGYYKEILQLLGEPTKDGTPYPLPDFGVFPYIVSRSIHSPNFLLVEHENIGLNQLNFHWYKAPTVKFGEGKVIVLAKLPIENNWSKGPVLTIEGILLAGRPVPARGTIISYSLFADGKQSSDYRYTTWDSQGNAVVNRSWFFYNTGEAPKGIWRKVAEAIKTNPLLPDERLTVIHPPTTRPLSIKSGNIRD